MWLQSSGPMVDPSLGQFPAFKHAISVLPIAERYDRNQLVAEQFALENDGQYDIYYAPFDYTNTAAKVMLVGVTPGWTQMEASFVEARRAMADGDIDINVLHRAKTVAAFSGALRTNLVSMLDDIGLSYALGIASSTTLFSPEDSNIVQSTSMLRYPVFHKGKNYSGSPPVSRSETLMNQLDPFIQELATVEEALVVPLGKAVGTVLKNLSIEGHIAPERCLFGFPHPSGAYAGRTKHFEEQREDLTLNLQEWFKF